MLRIIALLGNINYNFFNHENGLFIFESGQTPYQMTEPMIPSYRFKKMILALDLQEREQTLIHLANWVNDPTNRYGNNPVLSGWLQSLVPIAKAPVDLIVRDTAWNCASQFNAYPMFRMIVDKGLDVQ